MTLLKNIRILVGVSFTLGISFYGLKRTNKKVH